MCISVASLRGQLSGSSLRAPSPPRVASSSWIFWPEMQFSQRPFLYPRASPTAPRTIAALNFSMTPSQMWRSDTSAGPQANGWSPFRVQIRFVAPVDSRQKASGESNCWIQNTSLELGWPLPPQHHGRVPLQRFVCPIIQRAGTYIHMKASPYLPQLLCAGRMASSAVIRCLLKRQSLMVPKPDCCVAGVWQTCGGWTSLGEMLMCCGGHWAELSVGAKPCWHPTRSTSGRRAGRQPQVQLMQTCCTTITYTYIFTQLLCFLFSDNILSILLRQDDVFKTTCFIMDKSLRKRKTMTCRYYCQTQYSVNICFQVGKHNTVSMCIMCPSTNIWLHLEKHECTTSTMTSNWILNHVLFSGCKTNCNTSRFENNHKHFASIKRHSIAPVHTLKKTKKTTHMVTN